MQADGRWFFPLRAKLALAGFAIQLAVALVFLVGLLHERDKTLERELRARIAETSPLLEASLVEPLINRDYATITQLLSEIRDPQSFKYFVLLDAKGAVIASVGRKADLPLPPVDGEQDAIPWDRPDQCLHVSRDIRHGEVALGTLRFALSLAPSLSARKALQRNGIMIAALASLIGAIAFASFGIRVTRGLRALSEASTEIMAGNYSTAPVVNTRDEMGQVATAFCEMVSTVRNRIDLLVESERIQQQYLNQVSQEQGRLKALLHSMRTGILMVNPQGEAAYINRAFASIWDLADTNLEPGVDARRLVIHSAKWGQVSPASRDKVLHRLPDNKTSVDEIHVGEAVLLQQGYPVLAAHDEPIGHLWVYEDVTNERRTQRLIAELAERDSLTGLLNRRTFNSLLDATLKSGQLDSALVLFVDLDGFKLINDLHGHMVGDRLLAAVSGAVVMTFRPEDIVARIGGDEFAVLVKGAGADAVDVLCTRLIQNVARMSSKVMSEMSEHSTRVGCSIGVSLFPEDGDNFGTLIAAADQAMYAAKDSGRNTWCRYDGGASNTPEKANWLLWLERLNEAFEHQRFQFFLQEIRRLEGLQPHHYEALIRLENPDRPGTYYVPGEFIAYAEDSGKILALDRWMLGQAVRHLAEDPEHLPIAVNVSARTLADKTFADQVASELKTHGVDPRRLHLELTETAAISNLEQAERAVSLLQAMGCLVSLDDFGSGFTALSYIRRLHPDYIKVDGFFIKELTSQIENQILLRAIVDIAHHTGRKVVAEWVEDQETYDLLLRFDVDLVQGFWVGRPRLA